MVSLGISPAKSRSGVLVSGYLELKETEPKLNWNPGSTLVNQHPLVELFRNLIVEIYTELSGPGWTLGL